MGKKNSVLQNMKAFCNSSSQKEDKIFTEVKLCRDKVGYYLDIKGKTEVYLKDNRILKDVSLRIYSSGSENVVITNKEIVDYIINNPSTGIHNPGIHKSGSGISISFCNENENYNYEDIICFSYMWINYIFLKGLSNEMYLGKIME